MNILITVLYIFLLINGIIGIFAYKVPNVEDINTTNGIISEFKQRDGKWFDVIFGGATDQYFNITFNDDTFYEATGIYYDNIDFDYCDRHGMMCWSIGGYPFKKEEILLNAIESERIDELEKILKQENENNDN